MANQATFEKTTFSVGDSVAVQHRVKESGKERLQTYTGVVIAIGGHGVNKSFTVRKIASGGIGVERIWPLFSPSIAKIQVKKRGKVKRAKLYYLRKRAGKEALQVKKLTGKRRQTIGAKTKLGKTGRETG